MDAIKGAFSTYLPQIANVFFAFVILIIFYIVAKIIAKGVRTLLRRTELDNRFAKTIGGDSNWPLEATVGKVVFWLIMIFGLIAFFSKLQLNAVAQPLQSLIDQVLGYLPQLGGALLLVVLAWALASIVKALVIRGADTFNLDARLSQLDDEEKSSAEAPLSRSVANAAFWLIILLFLPGILSRLGQEGLVAPLQSMLTTFMNFIPGLLAATLIFFIGRIIARVVRQVLTNLIAATGADRLSQRVGMRQKISSLVGLLAYAVIMLMVIVQALDKLGVDSISRPATSMINLIFSAVPGIVAAVIVLGISYYIGKIIADLVADVLSGVGFNNMPQKIGFKLGGSKTPSQFVGHIILIGVMLFAALGAAELLNFAPLSNILSSIVGFAGQVILGVVILGIGLYIANIVSNLVKDAGGSSFTGGLARTAIIVLTGAMALRQMGLADDIVNLAFGIALGAVGIAAALAFGLGSRDIAGKEVERLVSNLRDSDK